MSHIEIRKALKESNFSLAFDLINEDQIEEFFKPLHSVFFREKPSLREEQPFWHVLFSHEKSSIVFQSEFIYPFLDIFWKRQWSSKELLRLFAEKHSKKFIESLRLNRTFLTPNLLETIDDALPSRNSNISSHLTRMVEFKSKLNRLEEQLSAVDVKLRSVSLQSLLVLIVLWWENDPAETLSQADLKFRTVNMFLRRYFKLSRDTNFKISREELVLDFMKVCRKLSADGKVRPVIWTSIERQKEYLFFLESELDEYCYNLSSDFRSSGEFIVNHRHRTVFQEGGNKLEAFTNFNISLSMAITPELLQRVGVTVTGISEMDIAYKELTHELTTTSRLLLDYLGLDDGLEEKHWLYVQAYSLLFIHAKARYCDVYQTKLKSTYNPITSVLQTLLSNSDLTGFPIQVTSRKEFIEMTFRSFQGQIERFKLDAVPELLEHDIKNLETDFSLLTNPLLKIDKDCYIRLLPLLGSQNIVFGAYLRLIDSISQQQDQKAASVFEQRISTCFTEAGFDAKYSVKRNDLSGDIDIIIREGNTILVLEAKRTKFRESSTGIWHERTERLGKGSLQLSKVISFLTSTFDFIEQTFHSPLDGSPDITGLIVSPWFEHDHEMIGRYRKVSWFELRYALERLPYLWQQKENKLSALIQLIEHDQVWPEIFRKSIEFDGLMKQFMQER